MSKKNIFETINSIPALLGNTFQKFAKKPAMILDGDKKISYNDMRWDIFKTSNVLRFFSGVTPKTVAIFIDDSPQAVESFYSVLSIGAKAILLRYTMTKEEIQAALEKELPDVIFIRAEKMDLLPQNLASNILEIADNRVLKKLDKEAHQKRVQKALDHSKNQEEVLAVTYSSGSERSELTRNDFAAMIGKKGKKNKNENTFDALADYVGTLVNALIKGRAVQASL
ncbi:MAG: AMP-binding protein [Treponema sp.]|nr:AMP-binding protein [Treponema sp.]